MLMLLTLEHPFFYSYLSNARDMLLHKTYFITVITIIIIIIIVIASCLKFYREKVS